MIDSDGFRPNVGIILANHRGEVLWARRIGQDSWQFPQGGIKHNETPEDALYRELGEEIGLCASDVEIISCTRGWLRYRLPRRMVRHHSHPRMRGAKTEMVPAEDVIARCACTRGWHGFTGIRRLAVGELLVSVGAGGFIQKRSIQTRVEGTGPQTVS